MENAAAMAEQRVFEEPSVGLAVTARPTDGAKRRGTRRRPGHRSDRWLGLAFVLPIVVLYLVFSIYPFARTIQLSFTNWDGLSASYSYVGLHNYAEALHDRIWWESLVHGLLFAAVALTIMQGIGLLLAIGVDRKIRGQSIYRVVFYLPPVLSGVVVAIIWKWLYQPYGGPIDKLLGTVGLGNFAHAWLGDSSTALWAVSLASIWQGVGSPFLLFLAGLQNIPEERYDAARVDGASGRHVFRHITLPGIFPVIGLVSVLTFLGAMQIFNLVIAMTNGGPGYATEVPVLHIYRAAFGLGEFGYATALSVIFGFILFVTSFVALRLSRHERLVS